MSIRTYSRSDTEGSRRDRLGGRGRARGGRTGRSTGGRYGWRPSIGGALSVNGNLHTAGAVAERSAYEVHVAGLRKRDLRVAVAEGLQSVARLAGIVVRLAHLHHAMQRRVLEKECVAYCE